MRPNYDDNCFVKPYYVAWIINIMDIGMKYLGRDGGSYKSRVIS